ncbi:MAG: hypothetical protein KA250_10595 [Verrucomicrobiales bacterium]|jgi:uncharacterized protein|nr:hypothetical protein [Verrucomicrobiales bacterium]MBP9222796.1 hypothetical protein [Verrucomicrobiales bacterium]HQZ28540.1 hypothetical protein [Verrucomicrobiales bacterium]
MEIFISDIPEEGLHLEGELPDSIFDLPPEDTITPMGPISYSADIYAFDEVIIINGSLRAPFRLQCGICLEDFDYDADFPQWSSELDLEPGQRSFELEEIIREDFLLGLPSNPRCDDGTEDRVCSKSYLLSDNEVVEDEEMSEPDGPNVWGPLDGLN